ncbi:MAG: DUF3343 domain-containing protein [Chloroflexi bacterium]|jgi:hypothetical protein|nr:DUF3343 domain-containing protein [Chloroflexota bacterium]
MNQYGVVLFHTTSAALRAEKILKVNRIPIKLIPTPRELSSDCGVALRFDREQTETVQALLRDAGVEVAGIYDLDQHHS